MAALQDSLTNLGQFQIPRPKCVGMEFVTIRGSHSGFYRSINKSVALKYGIRNGLNGKRPTIPENWIGQGEKAENGRMGKAKGGMIPEEPEMEPTPDYEMGEENRGKSSERIAVPIGSAPPAPPLLPEFRQYLLKKNRQNRQNGKENLGRNHFELMAAGGQKFVGAFWKKEQKNGMGNGEMGSIKL